MIKVTRKEVAELVKMGVNYGENGISKTHSHHNISYYLCESKKNMQCLSKLRENSILSKAH